MSTPTVKRFERPLLKRHGPNRGATNFYRAAVDDPHAIGGVPLDSIESAVTAAVRLGYKVADAQVASAGRLASRLREAGDRATGGPSDEKRSDWKALDATEQLIFKAMLAGLSFLEGVAADRDNPMRRLATSQFQMLGSLLGLLPSDRTDSAGSRAQEQESSVRRNEPSAGGAAAARAAGPGRTLQIRHGGEKDARRLVRLGPWEISGEVVERTLPLLFFGSDPATSPLRGDLAVGRQGATLTVYVDRATPAGVYKAAVCDEDGLQLGFIEITV